MGRRADRGSAAGEQESVRPGIAINTAAHPVEDGWVTLPLVDQYGRWRAVKPAWVGRQQLAHRGFVECVRTRASPNIPQRPSVEWVSPRHDVVVIGGGIAGVSIAYELAACRRVTLLETETSLAAHSTGRSAATYLPGHGGARVRPLINASGPRFARLAKELGAPALLRPRPVLWAAFDEDGERELRAELGQRSDEPDTPVELS